MKIPARDQSLLVRIAYLRIDSSVRAGFGDAHARFGRRGRYGAGGVDFERCFPAFEPRALRANQADHAHRDSVAALPGGGAQMFQSGELKCRAGRIVESCNSTVYRSPHTRVVTSLTVQQRSRPILPLPGCS